jgi:prepilin signal peptidase PulO-like enzyme (type II secretory pathway)
MIAVLAGGAFFGCVAYLGIVLSRLVCTNIMPFEDGPPTGRPPVPWLILGSAALGMLLVARGALPFQLGLISLVTLALVASWCSDTMCGIVPDIFTLGPLGAIVLFAVLHGSWWLLVSAAVPFLPFAIAAAMSHGRGMGWGDVKLTALAGAVLGAPLGLLTLALACIAAVVGYRLKHIKTGPIAFAPYIASAIAAALPLTVGQR